MVAAKLTGQAHGNHRNSRFDMAQKVGGAFHDRDKGACSMVEIRRMGPQIGVEVTAIDVRSISVATSLVWFLAFFRGFRVFRGSNSSSPLSALPFVALPYIVLLIVTSAIYQREGVP